MRTVLGNPTGKRSSMSPPKNQSKLDRDVDWYVLPALLGEDEVNQPPTKFEYWVFKFSIRLFFLAALTLLALAGTVLYYALYFPKDFLGSSSGESTVTFSSSVCKAPNPNIFGYHPLRASNEAIAKAANNLNSYLSQRASKPDIDSISVAVVSAAGTLFEGGYGTLRANETNTENQRPVDRDSIYRIASITKIFTVLETLILREKGALNWDDPVTKYVPDFSPPAYGWADFLVGGSTNANQGEPERITLRQLASHLGGIGRDYPPNDIGEWPTTTPWSALMKPAQGELLPNRTYENIMKALNEYPLVNLPYEYPIYSNIGFDLLGLANVAANQNASSDPKAEPQTHKELLKRDIFDRMGLTSSFYRVPESLLRDHIAVPSSNSEWADVWLGDTDDAAGGQYSSLKDLTTVMKSFLSPSARGGVIPARTVREWLRPLYVWGSTEQQVGAPWEIFPLPGDAKAYTKGGNLPGYHSEFALVPEYSYGIIVLVTGTYADTRTILNEVVKRFHPAITQQYQVEVQRRYAGTWTNGKDIAEVAFDRGKSVLLLKRLVIKDIDILKFVQNQHIGLVNWPGPTPVALWSTGRVGEFRLAFGRPDLNKAPNVGCFPYWLTIDPGLNSNGAPIDLLFWNRGALTYPSAGVSLARKK